MPWRPKPHVCRCGHEWFPRTPERPRVCPKCKSANWDRPFKFRHRKVTTTVTTTVDKISPSYSPSYVSGRGVGGGTSPPDSGGEQGELIKNQQPGWIQPSWFAPLRGLAGFKNRNYIGVVAKIEAACSENGVDVVEVVDMFAEYYQGNRQRHGWSNPVLTLNRTIGVQISKVMNQPSGSPHSRRNGRRQDPTQQTEEVRLTKARHEAEKRRKQLGGRR